MPLDRPAPLTRGLALALLAFVIFNANGREIGGYDSQPAKFAAIELARYGTLTLDRVVAEVPQYAERSAFARDRQGHFRSAYPIADAILAGGVAWLLGITGLIDLDAPLVSALNAKLTASAIAACAVWLAFLTARRRTSAGAALLIALGFGFGTNLWLSAQTLSQHETAVLGLMGAVLALAVPQERLSVGRLLTAGAWLALAGAARPQVAPAIAVLCASVVVRADWRRVPAVVLPVALVGSALVATNLYWFGHPLGGMASTEALHPQVHAVTGTFSTTPWIGAAGLLVSPSRGLLVFSPVVLVTLAGITAARRERWRGDLVWCITAAAVQFALYAAYTVWWGGHSYGPRYAIDLLPLLVPLAAASTTAIAGRRPLKAAAVVLFVWSTAVAWTGAFSFPGERWNTDPVNVDIHHERLWHWRDPQFVRCWRYGLNDRNFMLFDRVAVRRAD
jgi:hypothetical protein